MSLFIEFGVMAQNPGVIEVFTSSQTWTVPAGVTKVNVTIVGGGGMGSDGELSPTVPPQYGKYKGGCGGGGGYVKNIYNHPVTPGASISIIVGAANALSQFGSEVSNYGGNGSLEQGGNGGSGGGGNGSDVEYIIGGSNGSDGQNGYNASGGIGQHTTTYGVNGVLYAGGGGGGSTFWDEGGGYIFTRNGLGGDGGGGDGGGMKITGVWQGSSGKEGVANTGGGGGGGSGGKLKSSGFSGGSGGSGIVIVEFDG